MFKLALTILAISYTVAVAAKNTYFDSKSEQTKLHMMGARLDGNHASRGHKHVDRIASHLPKRFHSDEQWPHCKSTINFIKDQAACGSCWAVAATSVMADRACINCNGLCKSPAPHRQGKTGLLNEKEPCLVFSAEHLLTCCKYCGGGCNGGYPIDAMAYWANTGIVTGGWYGSKCGCQPYEVDPQSWSSKGTPACSKECQSGFPESFESDKHYAQEHYKISKKVDAIKTEIMDHGPVECAFEVYKNFETYPKPLNDAKDDIVNDVYIKQAGGYMGGHAIKVVGWDEDAEVGPYWIIHNSWNTTWGLDGMFKYKLGSDLGGMESGCVAGLPACKNLLDNKLTCIN